MSVHFYLHFLDEMAFILFLVNGVFMAFFSSEHSMESVWIFFPEVS